jgi:phosphonate transport system substrate-binding protein
MKLNPRTVLVLSAAGALAFSSYYSFNRSRDQAALKATEDRLVAWHGLTKATHKQLSPDYSDTRGRLLADPPSDPAKLVDPQTLVVAHYEDADADAQLVDWDAFQSHLAQATGKLVVRQRYLNTADDVAAIKAGKLHVVALHAADAPYVVNQAGFIPVAVLGTDDGAHGNHLDIAVRPDSGIKTLADLRGRKLTCTAPDSITGYRAAIAVLAQQADMRPDVDYFINFSHGQRLSILGLARGDVEIAALSDDKLQSMLARGDISASDYRVIYESQVVPRLTIGHIYNLHPELAGKVSAAVLDFANEHGATGESAGPPMHFLKIDYKNDFQFVRSIDDCFDPRFHKQLIADTVPSASDSAARP